MRNRVNLAIQILAVTVIYLGTRAYAQLPAFSGADGAAQFVSGGRGGIVYHVTRLNSELDDPAATNAPGSFLYGLSDGNFPAGVPRTIVFDVAGVFHLGNSNRSDWDSMGYAWDANSRKSIGRNITIAGQTAPGPVIIMGGTLKPSGTNIVIRNITIAAGFGMKGFWEPPPKTPPSPGTVPTSFVMDAIDVSGKNVMLDHLDAYYTSDEAISCNENAESLTIQYCNSSQGQNYQGHDYGHLLQGGTDFKMSFLHNFDAHHNHRLPRVGSEVGTGALNDFRNNVIYNWLGNSTDAGYSVSPQYSKNNFIHNFYLAGDGGDGSTTTTRAGGTTIFGGAGTPYTSVYPNGNLKDTNKDADPNDTASADGNYASSTIQTVAYNINIGLTLDAKIAFTNVLRHVGSRWWERDYDFTLNNSNAINRIDERLIYECITGTGKVVAWADDPFNTNSTEGVEWRSLWALRADTNGVAPFNHPAGWDTEQDGMPDYWELEHGLNPAVTNNNADFDNDGYTDLEEYINDVAAWPAPGYIIFNGNTNNRYALIHNWQVNGVAVNITNLGTVMTSSKWQPSKYDTAIISNISAVVDAVGQRAGNLRLRDNGTLDITNGWLKVSNTLEIATAGTATVNLSGGRLYVGTLTNGAGSGSVNFTGGTLSADVVGFDLLNQGGAIAPGSSPGQTHVLGDLTLQSGSSLEFELGTQSDTIIVDGDLTLGGTLNVTNLAGFGLGTYTLITYGGSLSGSLIIGSMPPGYEYVVDTSTPGQVLLVVVTVPAFQSIQVAGDSVIMSGFGPTNISYRLLASTDLLLPLNLWTSIATNAFDANGQFFITNLLDFNQSATFYRLKLP